MKHPLRFFLPCILLALLLVPAGMGADQQADAGGFIVVTNPPVADFYTSTPTGTAPFTVSFSDRSRGAGPLSWHWEFGDGTGSDRENPAHTYKADGEYTVTLTVT